MESEFLSIIPVLPSADVERDIEWYQQKTGFECVYKSTVNTPDLTGYAVLKRSNQYIHLQWHANTEDDPLLGGSVIRIDVKNIKPLFDELVQRGAVKQKDFLSNTPWHTNEFGLFDLNHNAIFFMEDAG